ncbi:MAG: hypothetical protein J6W96_00840 [Alphaproteobacteria bacterium]|nr:hypothetical protein [Alphaproteobacteria bacterium]
MKPDDTEELLAFRREQSGKKNIESKSNPFCEEMCEEMQITEEDVRRLDSNDSFVLKSKKEYFRVLIKAKKLMYDEAIPKNVKQHYMKFVNQAIQKIKRGWGLVDINNAMVRKSYLGLKKFVKYKKKAPTTTERGSFDENSPLLAVDAEAHKKLVNIYKNKREYQIFEKELYQENRGYYHMIPKKDRAAAKKIGEEMLNEELAKYGLKLEELFAEPDSNFQNATYCCNIDNENNDWNLQVILDKNQLNGEDEGQYCPLGVVALHELGHIKQTMPGISKAEFETKIGVELAPTIDLIVRQDEIYKRIHGIDMAQMVNYPQNLVLDGREVSLGAFANRFRQIKERYGYDSYEDVLLTKEAQSYICLLEKNMGMTNRAMRGGRSFAER